VPASVIKAIRVALENLSMTPRLLR
jgi:hypothetical protein